MVRPGKGRGITAGTVLMLAVTLIVLLGGTGVVLQLKGGSLQLNTGRMARSLTDDWSLSLSEMPTPAPAAATGSGPMLMLQPIAAPTPQATRKASARTIELTFGGTVAIQSDVRQSCYYAATRSYDFGELFSLIRPHLQGDWASVTTENLVSGTKYSDLLAPADLLPDLRSAGIRMTAMGFSKCLDKGGTVLQTTVKEAQAAGLTPIGAFLSEADSDPARQLLDIGGVRVAFLHYTDGLNATNLKKLRSAGISWAVSVPDQAPGDIAAARAAGAELVIVSVSWGKAGTKVPSAAQKALAQKLADAGADVIIGTGTHTVQAAERLTGSGGRQTLCCYGLGSLISASRSDEGVAGTLIKLTFTDTAAGVITLIDAAYVPTYIWHYKQDGVWHYRIVNAAAHAPDGMDATQEKNMTAARKRIAARLGENTPLRLDDTE